MNSNEINLVHRIEHHVLSSCPCPQCEDERKRHNQSGADGTPVQSHLKRMSVAAAHVLGYIKRRSPAGSVARGLMHRG